jgi:hypothetical protein
MHRSKLASQFKFTGGDYSAMSKRPSMMVLALASVVLAGVSLLVSLKTSIIVSEFTPVRNAFPFSVAWSLCVYWAYRTHGRRALWLLLGFPFAWFHLALLMLLFIVSLLHGGGV